MIARGLVSFVAVLLLVSPAAGAYHEEVLDNGLRVILIEHRANPMVASSVLVNAGVVHEPEGMNGASHFLEHLLFNGTESRTQRELYDEVDSYGAYNNATTREDHTFFSLLIQKEFLEQGLDIQADMLFHSVLPPDKFEKEKGIVLEEIAKDRANPSYVAGSAHRAFAYANTPIARPVLGSEESIEGLKRDDVLAFYHSRYVPGNMTLILMGDVDPASDLETVKKIFGAQEARPVPAGGGGGTWPPRPDMNVLRAPLDAGREYLSVSLPLEVASHDPRIPALELLVDGVADGKDSPLGRALTSGADPLVLSFSLSFNPRAGAWSTVEFSAELPEGGNAPAVGEHLVAELRGLVPGSPAWDRVPTVRDSVRTGELLLADKIHYYGMMLSPYLPGAPEGYLENRVAALEAVTDDDLETAAALLRESLGRSRATHFGPGFEEALSEWNPETTALETASGRPTLATEVLANGLEVVFERNDDTRVFAAHLLFRHRSASEPEGKEGIADFLHRLYARGTVVRDAAGLDTALSALGADMKFHDAAFIPYDDYYTTPGFSYVRLEMPADRWREGVALLAEIVIHPRLAPDDIEAVRKEMLDLQTRSSGSPRSATRQLLAETLAPGHPASGHVLGTRESIRSITAEDLRAFHDAYVTGRRLIVTASGPVDPGAAVRAVTDVFGSLPAGDEPPKAAPAPLTPPDSEAWLSLAKEQFYLALGYLFDAEPADSAALAVAGEILSDRLSFELREERGLAYSMGASIGPWAGRTRLSVSMGTRPENLDEAIEGVREGMAAFREAEIDEPTVRRTANAMRGRMLMRRVTRVNRAYFTGVERLEERPLGDDQARLDALLEVSAADVQRVIRRYVSPERCAVVTVR